jgi:hypothetical protein
MLGPDNQAIGRVAKEDGGHKARLTLRAPANATDSKVDVEPGNLYDMKSELVILRLTFPSGNPNRILA